MPLLDRDTIVDRPVLLDRSGDKEQEDSEDEEKEVQVIGEGGGPTINGMEFEVGSYNIVAASNLASVLATGEEDGQSFKNVFSNAAIQLYELEQRGVDITPITEFAARNSVDLLGIQPEQARMLQGEEIPEEPEESVNIEEIEDQITESEPEEAEVNGEVEEIEEVEEAEKEEDNKQDKPTGTVQVGKKTSQDEEEDDEE
jgi:hypothetical protein